MDRRGACRRGCHRPRALAARSGRTVEVRIDQKIDDRLPEQLRAGDPPPRRPPPGPCRSAGGIEERLGDRPDLVAARLLIDHYHDSFAPGSASPA